MKIYNIGYEFYGKSVLFLQDLFPTKFIKCNIELQQKYDQLIVENTLLRKQLKFTTHIKYDFLTAPVSQITHFKGNLSIIIAAGSKDKIQVGTVVMGEYGIIGRVVKVGENFSVVSLLGNDNVKIPAIILPSYQDCIVGKEITTSQLSINYLADNHQVNNGDIVITSGKDGLTPFGMQIGTILKTNDNAFVVIKNSNLSSLIVQVVLKNHI